MAGQIKLNAPLGGSVTLDADNTASNFVMTVPAAAGVLINADSATGAAQLPVGTTAQRPVTPIVGQLRFNSTIGATEAWNGTSWVNAGGGYAVEYLIVAGGGGAGTPNPGFDRSGAGGAGGLLGGVAPAPLYLSLLSGTSYVVTIGAGGAGGSSAANGSNSAFGGLITIGGGRGGAYNGVGQNGGSGGGGGSTSALAGGAGTSGQGFAGGTGTSGGLGGAGGGAGGAASGSTFGPGITNSYSGSSVTYAAGGRVNAGGAGAANTGTGGSSTSSQFADNFAGGSGVVIIRYSGNQRGTGGTITSSGGFTIHTFTTSGTFTA